MKIQWGILSTGRIAGIFAEGVLKSKTGLLTAVGSRAIAPAWNFARKYSVRRAYGSYEGLLGDKEVDAVYIATPHPMHLEWAVKAAKAGKHILCEKPLGMNASEAKRMVEAAKKNHVFFMEAFMYRCHPQTRKLVQLIRSGLIGKCGSSRRLSALTIQLIRSTASLIRSWGAGESSTSDVIRLPSPDSWREPPMGNSFWTRFK